jgi:hypothetical protein
VGDSEQTSCFSGKGAGDVLAQHIMKGSRMTKVATVIKVKPGLAL